MYRENAVYTRGSSCSQMRLSHGFSYTSVVREHRDFKFGVQVDHSKYQPTVPTDDKLSRKGSWPQSRDLFKINFEN